MLDRNWRSPLGDGELDLVVELDGVIVFVEVKARAGSAFGGPTGAVDRAKQRRVRRAARSWLAHHAVHAPVRFDVVAVTGVRLDVFTDAF